MNLAEIPRTTQDMAIRPVSWTDRKLVRTLITQQESQEKDFESLEAAKRKGNVFAYPTPKIEQELFLGFPINLGLYQNDKLLAYLRAVPSANGKECQVSHWVSPFEGYPFAHHLMKKFVLARMLIPNSRLWTYVSKENYSCLAVLHRISDSLPDEYLEKFEDQKNGLILVELKN